MYSTIPQKAAALFHALVSNHCFQNGNKRTAVIALDFFLIANGRILALSNEEMYKIATDTAKANQEGRRPDDVMVELSSTLAEQTVNIADIKNLDDETARAIGAERVAKMIARVTWFQCMLQRLLHHRSEVR